MIKDKRKKIALIYEGIKTEKNLFDNLTRNFFEEQAEVMILSLPADGNIYMLWTRLKEDDFETDLLSVLKEMNSDVAELLRNVDMTDFSEIYLFFDYDGHNNNIPQKFKDIDVLAEMLDTFNNETEFGKLYISYPMIESLKDISFCEQNYNTFYLPLADCANYKEIVGGASDYSDFRNISKEMWYAACNASRRRASLIVLFKEKSNFSEFVKGVTQEKIYTSLKYNFIQNNNQLGVLNSVPLFLIEYYGEPFWLLLKSNSCFDE
ncbi:MAG: hypothetical protein II994_04760 [Lachnospiraceae bacterium]|nr:hypothetical protein [Lachnospiraceae bacterium]